MLIEELKTGRQFRNNLKHENGSIKIQDIFICTMYDYTKIDILEKAASQKNYKKSCWISKYRNLISTKKYVSVFCFLLKICFYEKN